MYGIKTWHVFQKHIHLKLLLDTELLFPAGAPGDVHTEAALHYLGDVEISEDATLVELKSQVRLPPAAHLSGDLAYSSEILIYSSIS